MNANTKFTKTECGKYKYTTPAKVGITAGFQATNQHLNISNMLDFIFKHKAIILIMMSEILEMNNPHATPMMPCRAPMYKHPNVNKTPKKRSSVPNLT